MDGVQYLQDLPCNVAGMNDAMVGIQRDVLAWVFEKKRILQGLGEAALLVDVRTIGLLYREPDLGINERV